MSLLKKVMSGLTLLYVLLGSSLWAADSENSTLNLRQGVTDNSVAAFDLHMKVVWIMFAVAGLVFLAILIAVIRFRKSKNPTPAKFSHSTLVEIIWTVVPMAILIWLAMPAVGLLLKMEDASGSDITVQVTGHRWYWQYSYLDNDFGFYSRLSTPKEEYIDYDRKGINEDNLNYLLEVDNEVVLPIGKKIRFLVTSNDVIHSWWLPDFAVKKDAIPGFINETWTKINEPGIYRGVCAELCGQDHGFMPIVVRAVTQPEYDLWVSQKVAEKVEAERLAEIAKSQNWSLDDLMVKGKEVYDTKCAMCHQPNGEGIGTFPALKGSKVAIEDSADDHARLVIFGKKAMPKFGDQLTDAELAAVVTYERNAWGNTSEDKILQPGRVSELKTGQ